MSNKPDVYGFCEAGCRWPTVHKEDLQDGTFTPAAATGVRNLKDSTIIKKWVGTIQEYNEAVASGFDFTNVEVVKIDEDVVADIAQYASSDKTKGTIEERLTNLGFKEGTAYATGSGSATFSTNSLIKQGKMVVANLNISLTAPPNTEVQVYLPVDFRPKNNVSVRNISSNSNITISTNGVIAVLYGDETGSTTKYKTITLLNCGWQTN